MRPGGKSNGESPFFETPNLSFEGRVRNVAHTVSVHSSSAFNSLRHRLSVRGPVRLRGESAEPWDTHTGDTFNTFSEVDSVPSGVSFAFACRSRGKFAKLRMLWFVV